MKSTMIKALKVFSLTSCMAATLIACGGAPGWGDDEYDDDLENLGTASLASLQANLFSPKCGGCHSSGGAAAGTGLFLDSTNNTFDSLVNERSSQNISEYLVLPFEANDSYLITKLKGLAITGTVMPPAGSLSAAEIALVQAWITDGALFSGSVATSSLSTLQTDIFSPSCSSCHSASGSAAGTGVLLDSTSNTYTTMVNVDSNQNSGQSLVTPFNPDQSYLVSKIEGLASVGDIMPPSGSLSTAQISLIRDWISSGANQSAVFNVSSSKTENYDALAQNTDTTSTKIYGAQFNPLSEQMSFDIQLSGPLDPNSITDNMVLVYQIKDNTSTLAQSNEVEITHSNNSLTVTYLGSEEFDQLELQVNNPEIISIIDAQGQALDGDNDGQPGGMSVFIYPDHF